MPRTSVLSAPCLLLVLAASAHAQTFGPDFISDYSFTSLGTPPGVPGPLGGIEFRLNDPNILLVGGAANSGSGAIYEIVVTRNAAGHIDGFAGPATLFASAPEIDGGLDYGPGDVLFYTGYNENLIGQIRPGSVAPDKIIDMNLTTPPVASSLGTLRFVPTGFAGAGSLKVASFNFSTYYEIGLAPDGAGTFDVTSVLQTASGAGGPEGIVYVGGGNAGFTLDSVLVSEYSFGNVGAYEIDANGDPIIGSRRDFMTGLSGAEGSVIDPKTGDFLFSTFGGGDQVLVIEGFTAISNFCQANPNSLSATGALMGATGSVSVAAQDLFLTAGPVPNSFGIFFFSSSQTQFNFFDGILCLDGGLNRIQPFLFGSNNVATVNVDYVGNQDSIIMAGDTWFFQYAYRDQSGGPTGANTSDGLRITFEP